MLEVLCESVMGSPFMKYKAPPLEKGDYTPTFTCRQMIKDIDLILGACQSTGVPAPLTAIMRQTYSALISRGSRERGFHRHSEADGGDGGQGPRQLGRCRRREGGVRRSAVERCLTSVRHR